MKTDVQTNVRETVPAARTANARWVLCGLLFFATTINYVDRQVLSILKPTLQAQFGWREADYGWIVVAFQLAYGVMMPLAGRVIDRIGTRLGYAIAVVLWSAASMSHAFARTAVQFMVARFGLGVGEAANFPTAVRAVAEWFPREERSFATGIFNSGTNVGVVVAALVVPFITLHWGWQAAFFVTGSLGLIWLAPWLLWFGRNTVPSGSLVKNPAGYGELLAHRGSWAFMIGKFVTDPVWWFYLFWIPGFLNSAYHLDLTSIGLPLITIYLASDAGSIAGGWLYKGLAAQGMRPSAARQTAMVICAAAATPVIGLLWVQTLWPAVALIALAAGAHQGWSVNLFTTVSDNFPEESIGSVVGLGGLAGAVSSLLVSPAVGYWLDFSGGAYSPIFVFAGTAYLGAFAVIYLLGRRSTS